ncbi:MAG TPA: cytochrome c oxidase assembly protein, partial [Xanthobacteraceae bacterium]|nr:cytochrome c oxidase assembly protein [Xanthobacteraceae bacterium]
MTTSQPTEQSRRRRDLLVAAACGVFAAGMVGMAFAAVPLYDWFCRTTGFAGTPMVATAAPDRVLDRKIIVRLDANVAGGLPWRFTPERSFI